MSTGSFEINIDPTEYQNQINQLNSRINNLNDLASQYANMKNQAENAWGTEDANLAKAQQICDNAIQVVNQKIQSAQESVNALQGILDAGDYLSTQSGTGLDTAIDEINRLMK